MSTQKQYAPKTAPQPKSPHARYAAVPLELKARKQWVAWAYVSKPGQHKPAKVPINPLTGSHASSTDVLTWGTFAQAVDRCQHDNLAGIGFVLTALDPFVGIDLDHCRDLDTGEISAWAQRIIDAMGSYTEISPSGAGVRVFVKGKLPPTGRKKGNIEAYETGRFLTVTGNHLDGTPHTIENRKDELTTWHATVWAQAREPNPKPESSPPAEPQPADEAIIVRALGAKNGEKFGQLYAGSQLDHPSDSEADQALCELIAYQTEDRAQIDRIFRASGRMRPKWERSNYRERTIDAAIKMASKGVDGNAARSSVYTLRLAVLHSPPRISGEFRGLTADACIAQRLGLLDSETGEAPCVLPGHEGHRGVVFVGRNGDALYTCLEHGKTTLTLPQVRASLAYGRVVRFKDESSGDAQGIEHLAWRLRALHEAGQLEPLPVPHLELPKGAPMAARRVYQGLVLLLGLKKHVWPDQVGTTFSWRFAAAWCGMNERTVQKGMAWLLGRGYVVKGATVKSRYGKEMAVLVVRDYLVNWKEAEAYFAERERLERECGDEILDLMEQEMGPCDDPETWAIIEAMEGGVIA